MGSTQKLGTGTNVQERLAAIHDLDCPWRPADLEQRLGRIQRQGNTYDHVRDYRYVTEGTFDAYSYQTVERKQRFISQLMSSKSPAREAADLDADVVTLANIKALATGDPDIQRRMTLENEINQLKLLRASWAQQKADTRRDINQQLQPRIEGIRQAIREKTDDKPLASKALSIHQTARMNGKWEGMTINGQPVADRQTACRLLHQAAHQAHDGDTIAEYDGLPVIARRAATTGRIDPGRQGRPRARIRYRDARTLPDRTFQHRQPARPDRQEHGHRPRQAHGTAGGRRKGTRRRAGDAGRTIRPRGRVPAKTGRTRTADVQTRRTPGDGK